MSTRLVVSTGLMRSLCWLSDRAPHDPHPGFYRSRIWSGPLRGSHLSMQRLERPAMLLGTYERHVVTEMQRYVQPGSVAYDIGTHVGYMTLVLSRLVGQGGQVLAFEPDPANQTALRRNVAENRLGNVTVFEAAVADTVGEANFAHFESYSLVGHLARSDTPADATLVSVPTLTLDSLVYEEGKPAPAFLKIDVEGAEMQVLSGARRLMREERPVIVAEMRAKWKQELASLILEAGYRLEVLQGSEADWSQWGLADVLLLPQ